MKPFDLEKALAGEPVVTRSGVPVTDIHYFSTAVSKYKVYTTVEGRVLCFTETGRYYRHEECNYDLFMAPVKVEKWAVIMDVNGRRAVTCGELFDTEEEAVKRSKEIPLARGVARVEWEE